ncbi:MAG: PAS domain S-box protein [Deltaproteobacteria bacterium]|nr:PAS domain S-box protein [Deltaproteobacteria bacterium]
MEKEIKQLTYILDTMEDGIYLVRDDFTVKYMNRAMIRHFGEGVGGKCYRVITHRDEKCEWCRADEVFAGGKMQEEVYISHVDKTFDILELPLKNADGTVAKLSIYRDITGRKRREQELRASEVDYRRLFEHVGVGVYVSSKEGKFLNANRALLKMLDYEDKDEFLRIDIAKDLYVRPEDRTKFQEMIERNGQVIDYEIEFKRRDGKPIPVLHTGHVRYDQDGKVLGYEGINVDQTQRKQMERKLSGAYDFLNKFIQSSPNAIMATDMKGNVIIWNRGAEEILGYKVKDVVGKMHISEIYREGEAQKLMKMMRSPEYGGVGRLRSYPMVFVRRDGKIIEGSFSASIIHGENGEEAGSVGVFIDLGERLAMEKKLREIQEQLLQSEKLAAMGRLTSRIAHELNNPIYGIMNTLELMKTEIPPGNKRRKILEMALSETVRLSDMLRKMLSFSKPDEEARQITDINTLVDEILLLLEKQLRERSIHVSASFTDELHPVYASRNQLRQVFLNIVSNARDAMPEGGTLNVATRAVDREIHIVFSDTGVGIKKEHLNKIFDAFFTTKDNIKRVGLGLSVCYGFIKEHGGDIRVESKPGSGTTFTIVLPQSDTAAPLP